MNQQSFNLGGNSFTNDRREKNRQKKCGGKDKAMFAYGIIQLGSSFVSALAAIVLSFAPSNKNQKCSMNVLRRFKLLARVHQMQFASAMVVSSYQSTH